MPNLALIPYFTDSYEVHYIGSVGGVEKELVASLPSVIYHEIPCVKLRRSLTLKNLRVPFALLKSVKEAKALLRQIAPTLIFSKGGFVGLPVALASGDIPLILHESDSSLGLANKLALRKARTLLTAFDTIKHPKAVCVGAPLRAELFRSNPDLARKRLGIEGITRPVLLFVGGSMGAKSLNDFVFSALPILTQSYCVLHLTGKNETRKVSSENYISMPFCAQIADLYAISDYVVTRGGANALFELAALSKPCVCVPLSKATRGDQIVNADYFAQKGALIAMDERGLTPRALLAALDKLKADRADYVSAMRAVKADGTQAVVSILGEIMRDSANTH